MSSYCNYSIQTLDALKNYILVNLGYPLVTIELTDEMLATCINESIETFTKYASQDQDFLAIDLTGYVANSGILLPDSVTSVMAVNDSSLSLQGGDVNRLFSLPNALMNGGMLVAPQPGYGQGYSWMNYELAMQNLDLIKRMLGGGFDFNFNVRTKVLKLWPDPALEKITGVLVAGVERIRDDTYQYGEQWVKSYALALSKIILGRVRGKYKGTQLLGGANLETDSLAEGQAEKKELFEDLRAREQGPAMFWMG